MTWDLPQEVAYLEGYDEFSRRVQEETADMPEKTVNLLAQFPRQNNGRLSKGGWRSCTDGASRRWAAVRRDEESVATSV